MWLVMTIACVCAVGYQIYERVSFFGSWPVNVNVEVKYNKTLKFPAVTICNQNSFKATKAAEFGLYDLIEDVFSKSAVRPLEDIRHYNASSITIEDLFVNLGHDKHDLVVSCRWKNTECGPKNFTPILTDHGLCYKFSPNSIEMAISAPGIDSGLHLMLNIEQYEYMNGPHDSAGVKVLLHDPRQTPLVASLGQTVSTGVSAFAGINLLMIEYQPPPYGDCGSKLLNHTTFYTAEECFLDCMTAFVIEKCGCRDIYMTTNGSTFPAICNLVQYLSCIKEANDEFYGMFEHRCKCPVSCDVTVFEPTFSDGSLSNHAVDSLLTPNQAASLYRKLLDASRTKAKLDKRKQEEFRILVEPLNEAYTHLNKLLYILPEYLKNQSAILSLAEQEFNYIYDYIHWFHNCQLYVFSIGILQDKDALSNYLSESTDEFLHIWLQRIERLINNSNPQDPKREVIFKQAVEDLQHRKYLIRKAQDDITSLFHSFTEGIIDNDILFSDLNQSNIKHFLPRSEMKEALSYMSYKNDWPFFDTLKYCKEEIIYLYRNISGVVDQLINLTETAFRNQDGYRMHPVSTNIIKTYVTAAFKSNSCRYILNKMTFQWPTVLLEAKQQLSIRHRDEFYGIFYHTEETLLHLAETIDHGKLIMNSELKNFKDIANQFVEFKQHSLTDVYAVLYSDNVQTAITKLKAFSFEVDTRGQALYDHINSLDTLANVKWYQLYETDKEARDIYHKLFNNESFLHNPDDARKAFYDRLDHARNDFNVRKLLGNIDHEFIEAVDEVAQYLDNFNRSVRINSIFLKENFLKLNVFYRQLSYERISQHKGYDIFGLICDIGGSMGLFIGASMLTVVEVIDLLLGQTPVFGKKAKSQRNPSHTSDTNRLKSARTHDN